MKADLTRNTFDPLKHFTRVLMQQGRVQIDADWNEQIAILLNYLHKLTADLIGPANGPTANLGFRVADGNLANDFAITPGRYYVDGILCELETTSPLVPVTKPSPPNQFQIPAWAIPSFSRIPNQQVLLFGEGEGASFWTTIKNVSSDGIVKVDMDVKHFLEARNPTAYLNPLTFMRQPDSPFPTGFQLSPGNYLIYLDVWERLITSVEDDSIREVALSGADTAARSKLVCQVKHTPVKVTDCLPQDELRNRFQPANRGRLTAQAKQNSVSPDPCVIAPDATYRGPENQLYRVEIHTGGVYSQGNTLNTSGASFKWSRENGAVVFPIVTLSSGSGTTTVVLENVGRDDRFGLNENDWVEIVDDDYALQNRAESLLKVQSIESNTRTVTLAGVTGSSIGHNPAKRPLLRRWDQAADPAQERWKMGTDNAILIFEGTNDSNWFTLENGIQVQFQPADGKDNVNEYRTGDYWLIPARTAIGDIEWPAGISRHPSGVDHHYAPLAVITVAASGISASSNCQNEFKAMTAS